MALKYLNKVRLMKYTARGENPYNLRKKLDSLLSEIEGGGLTRPSIIEKWLTGQSSSTDSLTLVKGYIDQKRLVRKNSTTLGLLMDIAN